MSFRRKPLTVWDNNFWLDVNYLHIAKAALYCSAHFSAVLYAEIWCNCHRCVWLSLVKLIHLHVYMLDSHSTKILKSNMIYDDRIITW